MRRRMTTRRVALVPALAILIGPGAADTVAQVPPERLEAAADAPADWLTYSGTYFSQRYSELDQVTPANVDDPATAVGLPDAGLRALAVDTARGRRHHVRNAAPQRRGGSRRPHRPCLLDLPVPHAAPITAPGCGSNNRGVAILDDRLFMATLDAHVVALDATTGAPLWDVELADKELAYSFTLAPLAINDKVIVGTAGGDRGIRGFISALDAATGEEVWRFYTIPGPGEPGHETWEPCPPNPVTYCDPEAWMHGGASVWLTGSYDPELNLTYWGHRQSGARLLPRAAPRRQPLLRLRGRARRRHRRAELVLPVHPRRPLRLRRGADPGAGRHRAQRRAVQGDAVGQPQRLLLRAGSGDGAVPDRGSRSSASTGPKGSTTAGRPVETPQPLGEPTYPGVQGGTNWYSPSFSPRTELMYIPAWEDYASIFIGEPQEYEPGGSFIGGRPRTFNPVPDAPIVPGLTRGPVNSWTDEAARGAVVAVDALSGERQWSFEMTDVISSGILTTASDLLFTGARSGYFQALDARTGDLLWRAALGGQIVNGPMTYEVGGKQYVAVIAGSSLSTFALRD